MKSVKICLCLVSAFLTACSFAGNAHAEEDNGDHPLITRFPGSVIKYHDAREFDEYILPVGGLNEDLEIADTISLAGRITRIQYQAGEDRSSFEVYHSYESALKDAGFEMLHSGMPDGTRERRVWRDELYGQLNPLPRDARRRLHDFTVARYLSARLERAAGNVYVSLYVLLDRDENPVAQIDIIEERPMEEGLIKVDVDAEFLAREIQHAGHVSVHGIFFDTGKSDIRPESEPTLKSIARLLENEADMNLLVVGHTDNVGDLDFNIRLSRERADSVVEKLVSEHDIDPERLQPDGVGFLAPMADNDTEEGRARNRRVELIRN